MSRGRDFWSNRRAAVEAEEQALQDAVAAEQTARKRAELDARDDAEILAELDLPDPDRLQPGDDIRGFMSQAVPDRLRRRALRQLWKLNPVLANVDGLVDYGEDFTDSATVVENLQTAYQVGKGMLAHVEELARQAETKEAAPPSEDLETDDHVADTMPPEDVAPALTTKADDADIDMATPDDDAPETPAPRRMRFAFDPAPGGATA